MTEDQLQAQCTQWFWNTYPAHRRMLFAVPNGGDRDKRTAAMLQATGVVAGVSDLILVVSGSIFFVEMKTPVGSQSKEQIDFMNKVQERGWQYLILRDFESFKRFIIAVI